MNYIGQTVMLDDCPAYDDETGDGINVSGWWTVEERHGYEPSAYVWSPIFTLCNDDGRWITVDEDVLIEHVDPERAARERAMEAQWERDSIIEWARELWPCRMVAQ